MQSSKTFNRFQKNVNGINTWSETSQVKRSCLHIEQNRSLNQTKHKKKKRQTFERLKKYNFLFLLNHLFQQPISMKTKNSIFKGEEKVVIKP
jgi:hypothetical protein